MTGKLIEPLQYSWSPLATAVIVAFALTAASANAGTFTQKFRDIPVRAGELCDDVAFREGRRLTDYARAHLNQSIRVTRSYCTAGRDEDNLRRWQIVIEYEGDQVLPEVSTINSQALEHAGYKSASECEANLELERTAFVKNTGLPPFISYCRVPRFESLNWELDITAFGVPDRSPFDANIELYHVVQGHTRESFIVMVAEGFARQGIDIVHASMTNFFPYTVLAARYYAATRINIHERDLVTLANETLCPAALNDISSAFSAASVIHYGVYCVKDTLTQSTFGVAALLPDGTNLKLTQPETLYDDSEACEANRLSVIQHYQNVLGRHIIGGYCTVNTARQKFAIVMLEL
jgi:hypothetical protein